MHKKRQTMEGLKFTKQISGTVVKICFDTVEFSRLYEQDNPESAKHLFHCNDGINKGLKWFIDSENAQEMYENIGSYIKSVDLALAVYLNLNLLFENKEKLISTLKNLHSHLIELQKQISLPKK